MKERVFPYFLLALLTLFLMGGTAVLALTERSLGEGETAVSQYTTNAPQAPQTCPSPLRIMPVGDSITKGVGSTGSGDNGEGGGYREPLFTSLTNAGYTFDYIGSQTDPNIPGFDNDHEGYPGDATDQFINRIYFRLKATPADIVLIHLGTNDITNNDTDPTTDLDPMLDKIDQYESDFSTHVTVILAQIINRPCDLSSGAACVTKVSQTSTLNDNIANLVQTRVAAGDDIRLINMEDDAGFDYSEGSPDFADDKHPSNTGYNKMAIAWDAELDAFISSGCPLFETPPTITSIAITTASANQVYMYDVDATGDATITYSLQTAPSGMVIDSNTGLITWTPGVDDAGSSVSVEVAATNSVGSASQSFSIAISYNLFLPLVINQLSN